MYALHGDVAHLEADGGPAVPGVLEDVPLGGGGAAADEPDELGKEGQGLLPLGREQPLGGERLLQLLEPGEQFTDPTGFISVARRDNCPRGAYHSGFASTTTRAPSLTTSATASKTCR